MEKTIKVKWLKALRSGKYKQGTNGYLCEIKNGSRYFCCMGVLSDLYIKEKKMKWQDFQDNRLSFDGDCSLPAESVCRWAGLINKTLNGNKTNPKGSFRNKNGIIMECLTNINDSGTSFKEIAKIIEKHF